MYNVQKERFTAMLKKILPLLLCVFLLVLLFSCSIPQDNTERLPENPNIIVSEISSDAIAIRWSYISQPSAGYELGISKNKNFEKDPEFKSQTVSNRINTFTFLSLEANTKYYIGIRTIGIENLTTEYTIPKEVSTKLKEPKGLKIDESTINSSSITLIWDSVKTASSYSVDVSAREDFSVLILKDESATKTTYTATKLSPFTKYYFRVRALYESSIYSKYSESIAATTKIAPPVFSLNVNASNKIKVDWEEYPMSVIRYYIKVSEQSNFSQSEIIEVTGKEKFKVMNDLTPDKLYYFQVSVETENSTSPYATAQSIKTPSKIAITPPSDLGFKDTTAT